MPMIHKVCLYSGLGFYDVLNLPTDTFLLMLKESVLEELNSTAQGREYLKKCKRLSTTEIDIDALNNYTRGGK